MLHERLTPADGVRDPEARKGIRDKFRLEKTDHELVTHYRSPNELCGLYKALARWVLEHYREDAAVDELRCALSSRVGFAPPIGLVRRQKA